VIASTPFWRSSDEDPRAAVEVVGQDVDETVQVDLKRPIHGGGLYQPHASECFPLVDSGA